MKAKPGYTLSELLVTVSVLTVLCSISLISIASPKGILEKEAILSQFKTHFERARTEALLKGNPVTISLTPYALWKNDQKVLEFPQTGPWRIEGKIKDIVFKGSSMHLISDSGQADDLPRRVIVAYNRNNVAHLELNPLKGTFRFLKAEAMDTANDKPCSR